MTALEAWMLAATLLIVSIGLLAAGGRSLAPWFMSPTIVFAMAYVGMAVLGPILYPLVSDATTGAGARLAVQPQDLALTSELFLIAAVATIAAAVAVALPGYRDRPGVPAAGIKRARAQGSSAWSRSEAATHVIVAITLVSLGATVLGTGGIAALIERDFYLEGRTVSREFFTLGQTLGIPAVIGLAYVAARNGGGVRALAIGLLATEAAMFLSLGTRRVALLPVLVAAGLVIASPARRRAARLLFVGALLSILMLQLPLVLRAQERHGLIPYAQTLVGQGSEVDLPGEAVLRNVFVSFAITHEVAFNAPRIPVADLGPSINPLPGAIVGTDTSDATHRLNLVTPYSLLGEMRNYGLAHTVVFFLVAGLVLGYIERRVRTLLGHGEALWAVALCGTASLFVVMSLQYPTRGASRFLYYVLLADLCIRGWFWLRGSRGQHVTAAGATTARSQ